jgi:hypothetical protein
MSSKNLILTEDTELKHADPDSRQTVTDAISALRETAWVKNDCELSDKIKFPCYLLLSQ